MSAAMAIHEITFWIALGASVIAGAGVWAPRLPRRVVVIAAGGTLVSAAVSSVARWTVTGHPPIFGTYENTIAAGMAVAGLGLWRLVRDPGEHDPLTIRLLLTWPALLLVYGRFFPTEPYPLTISERSILIDIHVVFAWASFAVLLASSMAGIARIVRRTEEHAAATDRATARGLGLGFALLTVMMAVGAVYSYVLFGDWYRWDVVGASAMAAWLGYGASLHAYLMFGWRGRRLAWCAICMLPLLLILFWSWSLFSGTYHYFDLTPIRAW